MPEAQQQLLKELRCFQHHLRKENSSGKIVLDFAYGSPSEARASSLRRTSIDKIRYLQTTNEKKQCKMKKMQLFPALLNYLQKTMFVVELCIFA